MGAGVAPEDHALLNANVPVERRLHGLLATALRQQWPDKTGSTERAILFALIREAVRQSTLVPLLTRTELSRVSGISTSKARNEAVGRLQEDWLDVREGEGRRLAFDLRRAANRAQADVLKALDHLGIATIEVTQCLGLPAFTAAGGLGATAGLVYGAVVAGLHDPAQIRLATGLGEPAYKFAVRRLLNVALLRRDPSGLVLGSSEPPASKAERRTTESPAVDLEMCPEDLELVRAYEAEYAASYESYDY